jgi:hypothetical protein
MLDTIKVINDETYIKLNQNHSVIEIYTEAFINNLEKTLKFIFDENQFLKIIYSIEENNITIYTNINILKIYEISDVFITTIVNNIDIKFINYSDYLNDLTIV